MVVDVLPDRPDHLRDVARPHGVLFVHPLTPLADA
jgi:hypothetical protein